MRALLQKCNRLQCKANPDSGRDRTASSIYMSNPLLQLEFVPAFAGLGSEYSDPVEAAEFPQQLLRFRNDRLLPLLGLDPAQVTDADFVAAFGKFQAPPDHIFLAMRYHGYQFGEYNAFLGDGRGFLYGQVRGTDGKLYDLGTKGSGTTPYSRGGDGRLTLKGGVREILAAEALHELGVRTSRCLSLVETGERLWRGDEPSPARSSAMVRLGESHIRFGTFERLHHLGQPQLIGQLLDHTIATYYPYIGSQSDREARFYAELVRRVAELAAQWMAAGFCHGVLNTDNMAIVGESFDYGPYAFIPTYQRSFTAAYFDYSRRYCYGNQPGICKLNLQMLQRPLAVAISTREMEVALAAFDDCYRQAYCQLLAAKLGCEGLSPELALELSAITVELLEETQVPYHEFFYELGQWFNVGWRDRAEVVAENLSFVELQQAPGLLAQWQRVYHRALNTLPVEAAASIALRLKRHNPRTALLKPVIESVWEPIEQENDWEPFYALLAAIRNRQ